MKTKTNASFFSRRAMGIFLALFLILIANGGAPALARIDDPIPPEVDPMAQERPAPSPLQPASIPYLSVVQEMIDQVTTPDIYAYTANLTGVQPVSIGGTPYTITNRNTYGGTPIQKATQYVYEHFQSLGLAASYHAWNTVNNPNVVGEQAGTSMAEPACVYLVVGHLDNMPNATVAPGADDNASGSVGVMVAAEILSQYKFVCSIRYVVFTGEEQGLLGSAAYANYAYAQGNDIRGVLNLDMIGYNTIGSPPTFEMHTRSTSPGREADTVIAQLFSDVITTYSLDLIPLLLQDGLWASDHYSFWQKGYPAILVIEDWSDHTSCYHYACDTIGTLDMAYYTNIIKASVGTLAYMAGFPSAIEGTVTNVEDSAPIFEADILASPDAATTYATMSDAGGFYHLPVAANTYTVTISATGFFPAVIHDVSVALDQITVLDAALEPCELPLGADFSYSPLEPITGQTVTFTGTVATNPQSADYSWNFGDGNTGSGQSVQHTYLISDVYTVTMNTSDCVGADQVVKQVQVMGYPNLEVSPEVEALLEPGTAAEEGLVIHNNGSVLLNWELVEEPEVNWLNESHTSGQVGPQEESAVILSFEAPETEGVYTTTLQISSNDVEQPQIEVLIRMVVQAPCTPLGLLDFEFTPLEPMSGQVVTFTRTLTGGSLPVVYTWDFGDGTAPVSGEEWSVVSHTFPNVPIDRSYEVTLTATNGCTGQVLVTKNVEVKPLKIYLPSVYMQTP